MDRHSLFGPGLLGKPGGVVWHLTGGMSCGGLLPRAMSRYTQGYAGPTAGAMPDGRSALSTGESMASCGPVYMDGLLLVHYVASKPEGFFRPSCLGRKKPVQTAR